MDRSQIESWYLSGYQCAAQLPGIHREVPPHVRQWYERSRVCAGCSQRIASEVAHEVRGIQVFHPSCAKHYDSRTRQQPQPAPVDRVIAVLSGIAVSFDPAGCTIFDRDGRADSERFAPAAFDDSIAAGGQRLCINHEGPRLNGAFRRLANDGGWLRFRFELRDGTRERDTLARIRTGAIRGCSIAFRADPAHLRRVGAFGRTLEIGRAALTEIALCDGRSPAWYDTSVQVEP